jgi:hypothetical protein
MDCWYAKVLKCLRDPKKLVQRRQAGAGISFFVATATDQQQTACGKYGFMRFFLSRADHPNRNLFDLKIGNKNATDQQRNTVEKHTILKSFKEVP